MSDAYILGKSHVVGRRYVAVVIRRADWTVVYRSPFGNNTREARDDCKKWIAKALLKGAAK